MPFRPPRTQLIRARVSDELKEDVRALAVMTVTGDETPVESVIVRDALVRYLKSPDIAPLVAEGRKRLKQMLGDKGGE